MKKRFLTGLTPSSDQLHIGNYFGALKPMLDLRKQNPNDDFFLFLSNMHALTKDDFSGDAIKKNSLNLIKLYLACGFDPDNFFIYKQSDIAAHAQINWVMMCVTHLGFMERMHAYKDAVNKGKSSEISLGTLCYPILMAVDIVLYDADFVPVGKDQKQHVEFARDIAQKFNSQFGEVFKIPDVHIQKSVAVVPGIDGRKMSKSYNNYIGLLDENDVILKKIKKIPTAAIAIEDSKDPDECNVYNILKLFLSEDENSGIRERYTSGGLSFKEVKDFLYEKIINFVSPIKEKFYSIDDSFVLDMLSKNSAIANEIANLKVSEVYGKVGFSL